MHINFVTEPKNQTWILRRWCEEYQKRIPNSTISAFVPNYSADVNVFVNYALYTPAKNSICVFTHRERDERKSDFDRISKECDWCFAQSYNTLDLLPIEKSSILKIGVGEHFHRDKPLRVGVAGREYETGRKRYEWIKDLNIYGIEIVWSNGNVEYEKMAEFYDSIDLLLITGDEREGGPMCVIEALARGKMVMSTNTGWAWEYPVIRYDTFEQLKANLERLVIPRDLWDTGAKQIVEKSEELLGLR